MDEADEGVSHPEAWEQSLQGEEVSWHVPHPHPPFNFEERPSLLNTSTMATKAAKMTMVLVMTSCMVLKFYRFRKDCRSGK